MIDQKELRIGNWVYGLESQYEHVPSFFQVESLDEGRINPYCAHDGETWYAKEVTPIPLTTEILEKCGFRDYELPIDITATRKLIIATANKGTTVFYAGEGIHTVSPYSIHCEYLHQLQNLYFALTGSELKIEL